MFFIAELEPGPELGRGSFGVVHAAKDPVQGDVAAKIFPRSSTDTGAEWIAKTDEALAEAVKIRALAHDNIVKVHHFLRTPDDMYVLYVMELCHEGSLRKKLTVNPLLPSVARKWIYEAAMGLEYLHAQKFLHRDIKPDNILISRAGHAKIADFGLVTDRLALGFGSAAGTDIYAAPELLKGGKCSVQSEVWSLGVSWIHALHGDEWFFGPSKFVNLASRRFNPNGIWLPHIPKAWRLCANRFLREKPLDRCVNMQAFIDALSKLTPAIDWQCKVSATDVTWEREAKGRRIRVHWQNINTSHPSWKAWSEPSNGHGRKYSFEAKKKNQNFRECHADLIKFFASQT